MDDHGIDRSAGSIRGFFERDGGKHRNFQPEDV